MNLSFDFSISGSTLLTHRSTLEATVARFEGMLGDPRSPIRAIRHQPARSGEFSPIPDRLPEALVSALSRRGITQLYSHQAEAIEKTSSGNVVVVTPTASGKTLCYNLPVLERILSEPDARALYLFPTKALAMDQLHNLQALIDEAGGDIKAFTFDGDTPQDARKAIRQRAHIVLSNPDMLHAGILPHHTKWAKLFENLRFVVIDELHYYRGVYGSHLANVLRRLKRLCEFYGSRPSFICSSATIANPKELAGQLTGEPFSIVDRNGAPSGEKWFVFYNPPAVNQALGIRRSYLHESRRIAIEFLEQNLQTLVFANNRLAMEILLTYLKDSYAGKPAGAEAVRGYRGGYLPKERREVERKLRDGELRAVVATNALELGVDIGSLDAAVMAGYPGAIASTWQRAGRAGRRESPSIAVLVASSAPVDQYVIEHPEYFFENSPEHAQINPDNLEILLSHLKCAAFELPVREDEKFGPHPAPPLCDFLAEAGFLYRSGGCYHWTSDTYPADAVSLRGVSSDNFVVIDITYESKVIADVAFPAALAELHEKAIYLHEARQYQVEKFDYEGRKAYVRQVQCDYFTDAIDYVQVKILDQSEATAIAGAEAAHGDVRVNRQIVGFKKVKFYTLENVGSGALSMPEMEMHTTSFWLRFPQEFLALFPDLSASEKQGGLAALGNALRSVGSLLLMCDPRDLGVALTEAQTEAQGIFEPNLYLYDNYPGGIGQSGPLFRLSPKLLRSAAELIAGCRCESGCPSCTGPIGEIGERGKEAAGRLLAVLNSGEASSLPAVPVDGSR